MDFQGFPWLIGRCFLDGSFNSSRAPNDTPTSGTNIFMFVLLTWLLLAGLIMAQVIRHDMSGRYCAVKGRPASASSLTYLDRCHHRLEQTAAGKIRSV
jgi:hypothetical protein